MMPRFAGLSDADAQAAASGAALRAGTMLARGFLRKAAFGTSGGMLFLGRGVRLSGLRHVHHTGRLVIEDGAELQGLTSGGVHLGADVSLGARSAVRPSSYYGGAVGERLRIGDRSSIATGCFIGCSGAIDIGADVMLGPGVQLHAENHRFADPAAPIKAQGVERLGIVIEDDCWIGAGSIITAGVRIGHGSVIGAGSVVTRDVPPDSIAAGSPARVLRSRTGVRP
ncbi:acyltransferase [Agrococcus baldri]|uniref:Acyltransferase n=1 Tax=Agrococcus baldri TaxID=153730 RepID=A0AA87RDM3_9MICO|nr:acyltransferase [Agrococcus baldri]GEK78819.1 hypothetical protein ABA31_01700 [Agrococcus baldri]